MTYNEVYTSVQPIESREHITPAGLGVTVSGPFTAHDGAVMVDVELHRLSLSETGAGCALPVERMTAEVIKSTRYVLEDLTKKIVELHNHRQRLQAELARLERDGLHIPGVNEQPQLFEKFEQFTQEPQ